jgi:antitoxin (DNA-binding transcriptional repressor) of toxin-antitoxin stability system
VTRNGSPVAELHPLGRRAFISSIELLALFSDWAPIDAERFFTDLDASVDQGLLGE